MLILTRLFFGNGIVTNVMLYPTLFSSYCEWIWSCTVCQFTCSNFCIRIAKSPIYCQHWAYV